MTIDLDAMEAAARKRLAESVNRSAAQHWRAWKAKWGAPDVRFELLRLRDLLKG